LAAGLTAFFGAAFDGAATGTAGATLRAVRWSLSVFISAEILFFRSVNLAMLALSFAMALAVLETGALLAGFAAGLVVVFTTFGAVFFTGVFAAFGATFFAVAILISFF
jgi:hypothetical protein